MSVSVFTELRHELRTSIRDGYGLLWTDTELDSIINEAYREYSFYSGTLTGNVGVCAETWDIHDTPSDFIEPLKFLDSSGHDIPIVSWKRLHECYPDFRKVTGNFLQSVCFDFDGFRKFRLFPKLPAGFFAGTLYYRRISHPDQVDGVNMEAVKHHALYQIFQYSSKPQAENYFQSFLKSVDRESRSSHILANRRNIRGGVYF